MDKIVVENVYKTYHGEKEYILPVFKNLTFSVAPCDFVVILGKSGCGKTTLLNMIAGIDFPDYGTITVNETGITGPHHSRSMIFQKPCLLPWLNVEENIAFGCKLRNERTSLNQLVNKYIVLMGLDGYRTLYPENLSAGMAQRVAIARSLIGLPDILLLDEPFTALDYHNRLRLQEELVRLWQRLQQTIIFVTHDIDEALILGRRIVILSNKSGIVEFNYNLKMPYPRNIQHNRLQQLKAELQQRMRDLV